jgi:hypothetical protein
MSEAQEDFEEVYYTVLGCTKDMLEEYDPMSVAAAMMSQALSIYRTALSDEDYEKIISAIVEKKDLVKSFAPRNTH